jgi:hypothetical protein
VTSTLAVAPGTEARRSQLVSSASVRVAAGRAASLATRPADGEGLESERLKGRLGEMLLKRELLEARIAEEAPASLPGKPRNT